MEILPRSILPATVSSNDLQATGNDWAVVEITGYKDLAEVGIVQKTVRAFLAGWGGGEEVGRGVAVWEGSMEEILLDFGLENDKD